jgi:hypothetical protein
MTTMFVDLEYWMEENDEVIVSHWDNLIMEGSHPAILRTLQYMVDELAELDGWKVGAGCTESIYEDDGIFPYYEIEPGYHLRTGKAKPIW